MKIKWVSKVQKEVPGIGVCVEGEEYEVPDHIAEKLIKQGQAKEVKKTVTAKKGAE